MHTLGIDLSTDPRKTWTCEIDWSTTPPHVVSLTSLATMADARASDLPGPSASRPLVRDEAGLIAALASCIEQFQPTRGRIVGIDAPFGWPTAFVDAISEWEAGDLRGFSKRPELRLRATDRFVQAATGLTPMSVSTDRIGSTAMLCAEVLSTVAHRRDQPRVDRARASNGFAEVYPAAALRLWTGPEGAPLPTGGYKALGDTGILARRRLLGDLVGPPGGATGVSTTESQRDDMISFDDALDAFVCALVARAIALGHCFGVDDPLLPGEIYPSQNDQPGGVSARTATRVLRAEEFQASARQVADAEGWIHVPKSGSLWDGVGVAQLSPTATE